MAVATAAQRSACDGNPPTQQGQQRRQRWRRLASVGSGGGSGVQAPRQAAATGGRRRARGLPASLRPIGPWDALGAAPLFLGTSAARPSPRFSRGKFLACLAGIARLGLGAFCAGDSETRTGDERRKAALALTGLGAEATGHRLRDEPAGSDALAECTRRAEGTGRTVLSAVRPALVPGQSQDGHWSPGVAPARARRPSHVLNSCM